MEIKNEIKNKKTGELQKMVTGDGTYYSLTSLKDCLGVHENTLYTRLRPLAMRVNGRAWVKKESLEGITISYPLPILTILELLGKKETM